MTTQGMGSGPGTPGQPQPAYPGLIVRQKITLITNQYWIHPLDESGNIGPLIAFAEQKKMRLREEVQFFADTAARQLLFSFKSRQILDMAATSDVFDVEGRPIGVFRKDAAKSLLNSTWEVEAPDLAATGRERSGKVALVRRFGGFLPVVGDLLEAVPWQFHFDFVTDRGDLVMSSERQLRVRDEYRITLPPAVNGGPMDWRLAAALGVALDAFQGR